MKFKKFLMFVFVPLFVLSLAIGGINISFGHKTKTESSSNVAVGQVFANLNDYVVVSDGVVYEKTTTTAGVSLAAAEDNSLQFDNNGKLNIVFVKGGDQTGTVAARLTAGTLVAETLAEETNQIASIISAEKTDDGIIIHTYDDKNNATIEHSYDADYTFNQMITNTEDKLSYSNGAFEILSSSGVISLTAATTAQTAQVAHINAGSFTFSNGTYGVAKPASGTNTTQTAGRAFYVTGGSLTLNGVTIQNFANAENGGAVSSSGTSTINLNSGTTIRDCEAVNGGGVYKAANGSININGATLTGNKANGGIGGAVCTAAPLTMTSGTIANNSAVKTGSSDTYGGGIRVSYANATISGGDFYGNSAIYGGAIHFGGGSKTYTFSGGHVYNNSATHGGGIGGSGACTINITGGIIGDDTKTAAAGTTAATRSNYASSFGGGVMIESGPTLNISGGTIAYNAASNGGGIYNHNIGTVNVTNSATIKNNYAVYYGGGICVRGYDGASYPGTLSITDSSITGNSCANSGGGIYAAAGSTVILNANSMQAQHIRIDGNSASNGGAIYNAGTFSIGEETWIGIWDSRRATGNTASNGGGMYIASGTVTMNSGDMDENYVSNTSSGCGAGVYLANGTFNMYDSDICRCSAYMGGGVYMAGGTFDMTGRSEFYENTATTYGGGVYVGGGTFTFQEDGNAPSMYENTAKYGGAIACNEAAATINIDEGEIYDNSAELGGACYFHYTQPGASSVTQYLTVSFNRGDNTLSIHDNTATKPSSGDKDNGKGGAIYMNGRACRVTVATANALNPISFEGNSADVSGGVIYTSNKAILTLNDGTFTGNHSGDSGGAIKNLSDSTTINGGTFGNNTSNDYSGAIIHTESSMVINGCNFTYSYSGNQVYNDISPLCINGGVVTINGGTFKRVKIEGSTLTVNGGAFTDINCNYGSLNIYDGTIGSVEMELGSREFNVYGGTFNGYIDIYDVMNSVTISGGTFNSTVKCDTGNTVPIITGGTFSYLQLNCSANVSNAEIGTIWLNSSSLTATISDCDITSWFEHEYGAATATSCNIYNYEATEGASGTFTDCEFESYFHIQVDHSTTGLTFDECTIDANTFTQNGNTYSNYSRIGQYTACPVTFTDCEIYRPINVYAYTSTFSLTLTGCTFSLTNPILYSDTAALFIEREPSYRTNNNSRINVTINDCTFQNITHNGVTIGGGAIRANWCDLGISGCTFSNCSYNTSYGGGGAICLEDSCCADIDNSTFTNCTAKNGGAIATYAGSDAVQFDYSYACINNCSFTNCYAAANGGALYSKYGSDGFDGIEGCTFTSCHSNGYGGAIYTDTDGSDVDIYDYTSGGTTTHTTFTNCYTSDEYGMAIYVNRGTVWLTNVVCTYSGNAYSEPLIYLNEGVECRIEGGTYTNENGDCIYSNIDPTDGRLYFENAAPTITATNGDGIGLYNECYIEFRPNVTLSSNLTVYKYGIQVYNDGDADTDWENYRIARTSDGSTFLTANKNRISLTNPGNYSLVIRGDQLVVNSLCTITYDKNDGSGTTSTQTVIYGENFTTKPANTFSRTGYTFAGWGGNYPNASTTYRYTGYENLTLYAQWTRNTYTISYTMNDGTHSGTWDTSYTFSESSQTKSIGSASRTGYNGSVSTNKGTISGSTLTIPANATGNITVTWSWTLQTFTVTFSRNNTSYGSLTRTSQTSVPYGSTISVSGNKVTINGTTTTATAASQTAQYTYAFSSWSGTSGTITGNRTITANFTRTVRTYTVTVVAEDNHGYFYDYGDDGDYRGRSVSGTVNYGTSLSISSNNIWGFNNDIDAYPESGYRFVDYRVNGSTISSGYQVTGNVTVYAHFESTNKTITVYIDQYVGDGEIRINTYNGTLKISHTSSTSARSYTITIGGSDKLYCWFEAPGQDGDYDSYETKVKAGTSNGSSNLGSDTGGYSDSGIAYITINASSLYNGMTIYITEEDV